MSSAAEGHAAARAACRTGKPVWVAWTLHEDRSGNLRSEEKVAEAVSALQGLPVSGFRRIVVRRKALARYAPIGRNGCPLV